MTILSWLIGFVLSGMVTVFRMEEKGEQLKKCLPLAVILFVVFSIGIYGFFCGIKGLCPYA